jgi:hypothetical protein
MFPFALLLLLVTSVSGRQTWEEEPSSYVETNPGEDVVLSCRVFEKNRQSECIWQKNGRPVRVGGQDGKYEWHGSRDAGDCSLRVLTADFNYDDGERIAEGSGKLDISGANYTCVLDVKFKDF